MDKRGGSDMRDDIRRAFVEFLTLPTALIVAFLLLAASMHILDLSTAAWLAPPRDFLQRHLFADLAATRGLLGTIGGGMITVTSITFSLLLLAVQQTAASLTNQVFDQFLRRRLNQIYFGFFVGLTLYTLTTLATVHSGFNPIYGATMALLLIVVALYLLIVLIHSTINQMRPAVVIAAIHDRTLMARERQLRLIRVTRRAARCSGPISISVTTTKDGFVTQVHVEAIGAALGDAGGDVEINLLISVGSYVAFQDPLATVTARRTEDARRLAGAVRAAIHLERQRDLDTDPAYGVEQLATIGWTSISTAKSNPAPGILTIRRLRDILARWSVEKEDDLPDGRPLPVVYTDNVLPELMDAFESLAIVSSESMQHQSLAEIVRAFALLFERLPLEQQRRAEDLLLRVLATLGDHVLTGDLNAALSALVAALSACGRCEIAEAIRAARDDLAASIGALNSRSTRVPPGG